MGRAPCCDKNNGLKKGPWTPEEDLKLINYIQTHGPGNWRTLPKNAGLQRCGKSCRLRWTNYLRPDIKRGRFSFEEEETIIQLHSIMGNKWSAIAARLPGRTDNEIKNYWNTHIRKRLLRMGIDPVTHAPRLDLLDMSSILRSLLGNPSSSSSLLNLQNLLSNAQALMNPEILKLAATASLLSNITNNSENNSDLVSQNNNILQQIIAGNCQVQNYQVAPKQEFGYQFNNTPTTTTQGTNVEGFSSGNIANLSCSNSPQNSNPFGEIENLILQQNQVGLVQSLNTANQGLGYDSVLSSPNQMNSSSNYVNSSTEEERDSYCSELFKFEIPESLDISDFL